MKVQSGSVAVLLIGMLGCNGAQSTTETADRIESPEWKDTITTKDVGLMSHSQRQKSAESVILLIWKNGNSRCMLMLLTLQCSTRWLRRLSETHLVRLELFAPAATRQLARFKVKMVLSQERGVLKYRETLCLVRFVIRLSIIRIQWVICHWS